jgi:hypothetical protein
MRFEKKELWLRFHLLKIYFHLFRVLISSLFLSRLLRLFR